MKRLLAGMGCVALAAGTFAQQVVTFVSPDDTFKLNSTAVGTVSKNGHFLMVTLDQHTMWSPKKYSDPSNVVDYKVGIAAQNKDGRWESLRWSEAVSSPFALQPGETKQMPKTKLLIPIDGLKPLHGSWLVLEMTLRTKDSPSGLGHTYAHSGKLALP